MEISLPTNWYIQRYIRDKVYLHGIFSTVDIKQVMKEFHLGGNALDHLSHMDCIKVISHGTRGGLGESRNPNKYEKRDLPGIICSDCPVTGQCIIQNPDMGRQFGL